jgi:hypothetical protein
MLLDVFVKLRRNKSINSIGRARLRQVQLQRVEPGSSLSTSSKTLRQLCGSIVVAGAW